MKLSKREYLFSSVIIILLIVVSVSFFGGFDNENESEQDIFSFVDEEKTESKPEPSLVHREMKVVVDVKGAVSVAGVYELAEGKRVVDAVEMAGGLLEDADENKVNFAALLEDEMVIYIPVRGEEDVQLVERQAGSSSGDLDGKININSSTAEELQRIPSIGPAKAGAIVSYREENGPFRQLEELMNVSGIGTASFEKMKEQIRLK
ncbi:helix-hairpin-helix domain-containing protein [Anaerobacillus sp. MEB173]|uniref:helix-hairpin-helix domain-containing protein n=1 Tax=Anaerobacillus sp. MEB173 TaxID=3383345 RepID=UPI003F93CBDA